MVIKESVGPDGEAVIKRVNHRLKHAIPSENAFQSTSAAATRKGMKVNTSKTNLLCVGDPLSYRQVAFIEDAEGTRIISDPDGHMKVLGFHFSSRPTVALQVTNIKKKMRQRNWTLFNLRKKGFTTEELVKVYTSCCRPVAEYCDVVFHSLLTDEQDLAIERLQDRALQIIFGPRISGRKMRAMAGLETLRERRIQHCDTFAKKCLSDRFSGWFPLKAGRRSLRRGNAAEKYKEEYARCDRLKNSPVFL